MLVQTMAREWHGIDRFRLDKFMMLTRFLLRQGFQLVKNHKWEVKCIEHFVKALKSTVLNPSSGSAPFGLKSHITDIYMEELANVGADEVTSKILQQFLLPYCRILYCTEDDIFLTHIKKDIFHYLLNQDAEEEEFGEFPVLQFKPIALQKLLFKFAKPDIRRRNLKVIHRINVLEETLKRHLFDTTKPLGEEDIEKAHQDLIEEVKKKRKLKKAYFKKKKAKKSSTVEE
ncbi:UNVERIFIED_CONTAM: Rrp1 [Trichonephila clavipes]